MDRQTDRQIDRHTIHYIIHYTNYTSLHHAARCITEDYIPLHHTLHYITLLSTIYTIYFTTLRLTTLHSTRPQLPQLQLQPHNYTTTTPHPTKYIPNSNTLNYTPHSLHFTKYGQIIRKARQRQRGEKDQTREEQKRKSQQKEDAADGRCAKRQAGAEPAGEMRQIDRQID